MPRVVEVASFVAQSVAIGLALAFVAVLVRPELINRAPTASASHTSYADAVAVTAPAVVNIYTESVYSVPRAPSGLTVRERGLGSGVIIDREGYVVTNWHVIRGADQIGVQLADGRVAVPEIVGSDPETELALLKIDLPDLPEVNVGRSDTLAVGDVVLAIGNSLGLSQSVTMGIVSATGRGLNVATFEEFIQTDAAINVGNSGGALINTRGELVGINTAVISFAGDQTMPEGLGFAIPINLVRGVMQQLIAHGRVIRGNLGVGPPEPRDLSAAQTAPLGIEGPAVLITGTSGPAEAAGLRAGDVLTHINGERMFSRQQALTFVASSQPGEHITIRAVHPDGTPFETDAVLEERPPP
jgi:serine protease DegS